MIILPELKVFIQKLDHTVAVENLKVLCLPPVPTLDDLRAKLQDGPLGEVERDIFFPNWTNSVHVLLEPPTDQTPSCQHLDDHKITVTDSEQLQQLLKKEEDNKASFALILQECRSKRYTRKKDLHTLPFDTSPVSTPVSSNPSSPKSQNSAPNVKAQRHSPKASNYAKHQQMHHTPVQYEPAAYYYEQYIPLPTLIPQPYISQGYPLPVNMLFPSYFSPPQYVQPCYPAYYTQM